MNEIREITNPRMRVACIGWYSMGCGYENVGLAALSLLVHGNPLLIRMVRRWRKTDIIMFFLDVIREEIEREQFIEEWKEQWGDCHG